MRTKREGSLSAFGLLAMAVILIASLGISGYVVTDMKRSRREQYQVKAFEAAQAGLEQAITNSYFSLAANGGVFTSATYNFSDDLNAITGGGSVVATVAPNPAMPSYAWVTCTATVNGFKKSLRTLMKEHNVGIWNNAIFAGSGALGQAINGNVSIAGSVHILGEGEPFIDLNGNGVRDSAEAFTDSNKNGVWDPGEPYVDSNGDGLYTQAEPYNDTNGNGVYDPPMTQTDLDSSFSGTGSITNNYLQMPLSLQSMVPSAPTFNGVQTLSSEVRVKHGRIGLSGTAYIGQAGIINGGTMKGPVDGTFVTDGWAGNQGAANVTSDNGTSNPYDVGGLGIQFPIIYGIGAQGYTASDGSSWPDEDTYLQNRSLSCPVTNIVSTTSAFSYGPDVFGNSISFTPANGATPAKLTITGIVRFASDLQIGTKDKIYYEGNGSLYAPNIYVDGDLLPAAGKTFPTTARIGLIAKQNMYLASGNGSAQLSLAGAFYAQGKIYSAKQNQIAGTFVSNYFDMGKNVPNIYQVPSLPYNMPPGMPGDRSYFTIKTMSWRERTPEQAGN